MMRLTFAAIGLLLLTWLVPVAAAGRSGYTDRLIIKLKPSVTGVQMAMSGSRVAALGVQAGANLNLLHGTVGGAEVLGLGGFSPVADVQAMAARVMADPSVEYAEPDYIRYPAAAVTPNDHYYADQWPLQAPSAYAGATDVTDAWGILDGISGDKSITVAVADTGYLSHADLAGQVFPVSGQSYPYGYDFISADSAGVYFTANDGDGRDPNPSDPGDWVAADDCYSGSPVKSSSWHGTLMDGLIAALRNNTIGIAGILGSAKLLPVRVLGRCGGYTSDISAGVEWAAGGSVSGVPANAHPARVINLSLGGAGSCSITEQNAINTAIGLGAVVVVAAGNDALDMDSTAYSPATCSGVITVAALTPAGALASYSNYGSAVALAAPGGESGSSILSTWNNGTTTPGSDTYGLAYGTSMATPHVSGVAAMMLAGNHALSGAWLTPAQIKAKLLATVRTFPTGTGADCTTSTCGAGMLDANAALAAVTTAPTVNAGASQSMDSGKLAHLNGSASDDPHGSIVSWQWSQIDSSGYGVILSSTTTASTSFTVPAAPTGTVFTFRLTATDDTGLSGSATTNVTVGATIPVFTPVGDQSVSAGTTMRFTVTAADGDGTIPLLSASGLPAGAGFSDNGDGTGSFVWPTPAGSNSSADVTFRATDRNDPSLYETMDVSVSGVVPASSGEGGGGGGGGAISPLALVTLLVAALRRRRAM